MTTMSKDNKTSKKDPHGLLNVNSIEAETVSADEGTDLEYVPGPDEVEAQVKLGPREFRYVRKISLSNYAPKRRYETEDFGVTHDSFAEARAVVETAVKARIKEISEVKNPESTSSKSFSTKE